MNSSPDSNPSDRPTGSPRQEPGSGRLALLAALALAMLLTWAVREIHNVRINADEGSRPPDPGAWFISDPDSHYHVRRLARLLEDGSVSGTDDYLNHPHGAAIPWPPYYTYFLAGTLGPFAPALQSESPADALREPHDRRLWLEQKVSLVPCALAVLTALALGLGVNLLLRDWLRARALAQLPAPAQRLAGPLAIAALVAGCELAFYNASVQYSGIGVGDHHAFVTCLTAWIFVALMHGLARCRSASRASGWIWGGVAGVLTGILLGAWVGGLMYVLIVQAALGLLLVASGLGATGDAPDHSGRRSRGQAALAPLGFGFHVAALLALAPAVLASPWKVAGTPGAPGANPWMVVNLSWFHLGQLALGALVFVPLLPRRTLGSSFARAWPFAVAALLVLLGGGSWLLEIGPAAGIKEGFEWAGRSNQFMDYITESQPMFGRVTGGFDVFLKYVGPGGVLLPLGWLLLAARAWRARETAAVIPLVAAPLMLVQALAQRRFADTLVVPLALILGWLAFELALLVARRLPVGLRGPLGRRAPATWAVSAGLALLALGATAAANWRIASDAYLKMFVMQPRQRWSQGRGARFQRETRLQLEWLRSWEDAAPGALLAQWERGHTIEWGADRPTVGTNFGIYVGVDSYLDPWRFLLAEDPTEAERMLVERQARYVQVTAHFARMLPTMLHVLAPDTLGEYYAKTLEGAVVFERLYATLGAQLSLDGRRVTPTAEGLVSAGTSVDFLRLVHVTDGAFPTVFLPFSPGPFPLGLLYEHVPGARLTARGAPGQTLSVALELHYDLARRTHVVDWQQSALVDADGKAELRVPYSTTSANGIGHAISSAAWTLGQRSGRVDISEEAVLNGSTIELP